MALRTEALSLRVSPEEEAMMAKLADRDGVTIAGLLRMLVRREWIARYGEDAKPPKPPKPRAKRKTKPTA